jgi:hypothetical protein
MKYQSALHTACVFLSGCTVVTHIPEEFAFYPVPVVQGVEVTWIVADNTTDKCKKLFPEKMQSYPHIPACAGWSHEAKTCVIVTGKVTTHQILGHETRHCFEGAFHE